MSDEGPKTPGVPLVAVAHGSADARSARAVEALFERVRAVRPGLDVRVAYLDHVAPGAEDALTGLAAEGAGEAVVLPALLTAAYHSRVDLPAVLDRVRQSCPWLGVHYGATLGPHPLLLEAVERRLSQTPRARRAGTSLVLASAGSSHAGANAVIARAAADLQDRGPWERVVPAFASAASPTPGEAVANLYADGAERVAVADYLLAPGYFADRVAEQSFAAGAVAVSPALGDAPEVAEVVLRRYDEALGRVPLPDTATR
ncbi:sirohydrochlorin chelatase [Streptomonospora wellingtoniae]|uniref:CbiX/SirB N-terminal domain-containing protein n=1 Tax=Streptomonospora wellingtoniae TaxID=3075544 RepID=A0ABU2L0L1_9ACTN|nr:CbiX/SirB N-terminal domain-containing protein [Streptomonospora sp. DSM 45055]MDT0305102.1 CbiX/SirB N-terminal domain-containing protein [Streptomonospora sp. DSM 45055]